MSTKENSAENAVGLDVYQRADHALQELIAELAETMETKNLAFFTETGYQMVAAYHQKPVSTGKLALTFACVLQDILAKLELTQESETISMIRDAYIVMKLEE